MNVLTGYSEMGNAGARVNGMDEAPMKFSDTIRMSPHLLCDECRVYTPLFGKRRFLKGVSLMKRSGHAQGD